MKRLLTVLFLCAALAEIRVSAQTPKAQAAPGDPRAVYIVVLNHEKGAEPDFAAGGAKQLGRWSNRVVVELPPAAIQSLQKHGRVKFIQHLEPSAAGRVATQALRTAPGQGEPPMQADTGGGTLTWTTGDYQYDGSGNIKSVGPGSDNQTRRYRYDELDRLVEAGMEASGANPGVYSNYSRYSYDSFGNRLTENTPTSSQTLTADRTTNQIAMSGATIVYDGVGNMTQDGSFYYHYDPVNSLTMVEVPGSGAQISVYDANDERILLCKDGGGACRWTLRGLENEVRTEFETDTVTSHPTYYLWVEDYVYRGGQLAGAQRNTGDGGRLTFHLDHLGSNRLTTNSAGQKVEANEFAPFGRELTSIAQEAHLGYDGAETHRFTGHERDFLAGSTYGNEQFVDYMHARTYQPKLGRFLSVDPLLGDPEVLQSWNRYAYARNSPLVLTDPTGEFVDLSALTPDQRKRLIAGLNDFTGNTYTVDPKTNYLVLVSVGQNSSATATAYIDGLIASGSYKVVATTKPGESWYNAGQNRIEVDFNAFDGAEYHGVDRRTFNLGSSAIHEWTHQTTGLFDTPDGQRLTPAPEDFSWTGPVVDAVNVMRAERGLPTRAAYYAERVRPAGFRGFFGIGEPRSAVRFLDPRTGRIVKVIRNVP